MPDLVCPPSWHELSSISRYSAKQWPIAKGPESLRRPILQVTEQQVQHAAQVPHHSGSDGPGDGGDETCKSDSPTPTSSSISKDSSSANVDSHSDDTSSESEATSSDSDDTSSDSDDSDSDSSQTPTADARQDEATPPTFGASMYLRCRHQPAHQPVDWRWSSGPVLKRALQVQHKLTQRVLELDVDSGSLPWLSNFAAARRLKQQQNADTGDRSLTAASPDDQLATNLSPPSWLCSAAEVATVVSSSAVQTTDTTTQHSDWSCQPPEVCRRLHNSCLDRSNERMFFERGEALFLGTGAAAPSRNRGCSSVYIHLHNAAPLSQQTLLGTTWSVGAGALIDVGEGTWMQLLSLFGEKICDGIIEQLRFIWISHHHADHHMGA